MSKEKIATETIDRLFLELSQVTTALTQRERNLETRWFQFSKLVSTWLCEIQDGHYNMDRETLELIQLRLVELTEKYPSI